MAKGRHRSHQSGRREHLGWWLLLGGWVTLGVWCVAVGFLCCMGVLLGG